MNQAFELFGFRGMRVSPLQMAVTFDNLGGVRMLLDAKAAVNQRDSIGGTPLLAAAESGRVEMVRMLLAAKGKLALNYVIMG